MTVYFGIIDWRDTFGSRAEKTGRTVHISVSMQYSVVGAPRRGREQEVPRARIRISGEKSYVTIRHVPLNGRNRIG